MAGLTVVALVLAGGLGAVARFVVDGEVKRRWAPALPWATFGINVSGSLLLGVLAGLVASGAAGPAWQDVVGTGFCGGYTTFGTASFETVRLLAGHGRWRGVAYALGTVLLSVGACAGGWALTGP